MSDNLFGDYIRQRREDAWLTRTELAKRANLSVSLIEKIELGTRPPTLHSLQILFDELEVAPMYRRHILNLSLPGLFGTAAQGSADPTVDDLTDLETLVGPASFYLLPTFTVVAGNRTHYHAFPGLRTGTSFIEWMLLHPAAREIMVDWAETAHQLIHNFRMLSPNLAAEPRTAELVERCRTAAEWDELWHRKPPIGSGTQFVRIRDAGAHRVRTMQVRVYSPEYPSRHWWLCRLIPPSSRQ